MRALSRTCLAAIVAVAGHIPSTGIAQPARGGPPPLGPAEIGEIARLLMLEDTRRFDAPELTRLLASPHPELRRRAAQAIGRIPSKDGIPLLSGRPLDRDTAVAATAVWAIGQIRDSSSVVWLDSLLKRASTPPTVLNEAATALGKIITPASRASLAAFLTTAQANARTNAAIGSALLSIGRQTVRGDLAPIVKWSKSTDEEIRWRATWALFRGRDPAAVAPLLELSRDRSPLVRSWAVRGLTRARAESAGKSAEAMQRLIDATRSPDHREATEAVTALGSYSDTAVVAPLVAALGSEISWVAVAAGASLGMVRSPGSVSALVAAAKSDRSCAVRYTAQTALQAFAPTEALGAARLVARDTTPYCRAQGYTILGRSATSPGIAALLDSLRAERRADLRSPVMLTQYAAIRAMNAWADSTDLPALRAIQERARNDSTPVAAAATALIDAIGRRASGAAPGGRGGGGGGRGATPPVERTIDEYRRIVERWVVPAYNGQPNPTVRWDTPRGRIDIEIHAADAPLGAEELARIMATGIMLGTEFTRVVPDFVDQQASIPGAMRLRDEVTRHGLTRANLSWASSGLDTGMPGYTLGHTPQPHNEGNFTTLGRVYRGMDVVDRLELGDRILLARLVTGGRP